MWNPHARLWVWTAKYQVKVKFIALFFLSLSFFFSFPLLFGDAPTTCGGSQPGGLVRATAAGLHRSHSNVGSKPRLHSYSLHHSSWQCWILNPLREARVRTGKLMVSSCIRFCCHNGNCKAFISLEEKILTLTESFITKSQSSCYSSAC